MAIAAGVIKESKLYQIDPTKVTRTPGFNPRIDFGDMAELAASIKVNGLVNPLRVRRLPAPTEAGHLFVLVDGDRRLTAIEQLLSEGHQFAQGVPAVLVNREQTATDDLVQMILTNEGKPFTPLEAAHAFKRLRDAGLTVKQISERVGRSQVLINASLGLLNAAPEVQTAAAAGEVSVSTAREIARVAKGNAGKQKELLKKAKEVKSKGPKANKQAKKELKVALQTATDEKATAAGKKARVRVVTQVRPEPAELLVQAEQRLQAALKAIGHNVDFTFQETILDDYRLAAAFALGVRNALAVADGKPVDDFPTAL